MGLEIMGCVEGPMGKLTLSSYYYYYYFFFFLIAHCHLELFVS